MNFLKPLVNSAAKGAGDLPVLSKGKLGALDLREGVSVGSLQRLFPRRKIDFRFLVTEGADILSFQILDSANKVELAVEANLPWCEGETLSIQNTERVAIKQVRIQSKSLTTDIGIRIGDQYKEIKKNAPNAKLLISEGVDEDSGCCLMHVEANGVQYVLDYDNILGMLPIVEGSPDTRVTKNIDKFSLNLKIREILYPGF